MRSRLARPLLYLGTLAVVLGLGKLHAAAIGRYDFTGSSRFAWSLTYVAVLCVAAYGLGLPDLQRTRRSAAVASMAAASSGAVAVSLVQLVGGAALLPRFVVAGSVGLLVPLYLACAGFAMGARARASDRDRVVVVGGRHECEVLRHELDAQPERPAALVGCMSLPEAQPTGTRSRPLVELAVNTAATVVVLDREAQADDTVVAQAAALHEAGIRVRTLALFFEEWLGKLPIGELERVSLMFDIGELHRARYGRVKRLLDLAMAVPLTVAFAVAVPLVLIGNRLANRGPLLYRQERTGKHGSTFRMLKFRTMREGDGAGATDWTGEDDPRVTPFGRILRVTHLDELPQAINLLRGDLSFVGPRPEQPSYVEELREKLPFYDVRHLIRPGLTGWAQVKFGYAGTESDALEKLQYEFFYLRRQGLALDVRIIGRTIRAVLGRGGR
ncbi:MAG: sugar transferase [Actinomycetota bacterium]